ncbi:MAG: leucyl aminopeptidase [Pelagibacterales bacterium]|nr:leucyl aminopeptidase [Pelagibacterales bacterium]
MKINFSKISSISALKNSVAVIVLSEEQVKKSKSKLVKYAKENFDFEGKYGQINLVAFLDKVLVVAGLGEEKKVDNLALQRLGSRITAFLNSSKIKDATVFLGYELDDKGNIKSYNNKTDNVGEVAFGSLLQSYRFNKYFEDKKKNKELKLKSLSFVVSDIAKSEKIFDGLKVVAENVFFVRDLVSEPCNVLNPETYAEICKTLKKEGLEVQVLGESEMKKLGMNSLLGVGQGSIKESQLVVLKWNGAKNSKEQPLAFVGKGVTFDTGGISIKPAQNMEDMKTDMAGSAVVVGLLRLLAQRKAKVNVVGVIGLVENMPSGSAQRPGDVVKSMSGQTIEIVNTDAEGRLVLADALHYTNTKFKPKLIVDLATLTGAIIVALADVHAGMFSNDDNLAKQLEQAGKETAETLWRMPLGDAYDEMINSDIADMKNVGSGRGAGSGTAAQFLQRFIGKTKWAHLDIAGVAWKGKGDPMAVKGATGYGVRLLNQFIINNYEK